MKHNNYQVKNAYSTQRDEDVLREWHMQEPFLTFKHTTRKTTTYPIRCFPVGNSNVRITSLLSHYPTHRSLTMDRDVRSSHNRVFPCTYNYRQPFEIHCCLICLPAQLPSLFTRLCTAVEAAYPRLRTSRACRLLHPSTRLHWTITS